MASLKTEIIKNKLALTWDGRGDFHSEILFEWRSQLIHLKVDVRNTWKSRTEEITIIINNESFKFGLGRSSIGGGRMGKQPRIETTTHYLTFEHYENNVHIIDNVKDGLYLSHNGNVAGRIHPAAGFRVRFPDKPDSGKSAQ